MPTLALMPEFKEFALCPARFMFLAAGRGAGKTNAIIARIKLLTTKYPKFRYMYVTPLSVQGDEVYEELISDREFMKHVKSCKSRPYPKINLKNRSKVWFRSFQRPRGLVSTGEDEIVIDESQDEDVTEADVNRYLRPMLARRTNPMGGRGRLIFAGQFKGEDWRYQNYFVPGQEAIDGVPNPRCRRPMNWSWKIPTSRGFKFQDEEGKRELEIQRETTPKPVWDEQYECLVVANADAVFPPEQVDACVNRLPMVREESKARPLEKRGDGYVMGVDVGKDRDPTYAVVMHSSGDIVYRMEMPLKTHHRVCAEKVCEVAARFGASIILDATGEKSRDPFVELYRAAALPWKIEVRDFIWNETRKTRIMHALQLAIQQCEIGICPEFKDLIHQLKRYRYQFSKKTKHFYMSAPQGEHDDGVSSVAMAHEARNNGWIGAPGSGVPVGG